MKKSFKLLGVSIGLFTTVGSLTLVATSCANDKPKDSDKPDSRITNQNDIKTWQENTKFIVEEKSFSISFSTANSIGFSRENYKPILYDKALVEFNKKTLKPYLNPNREWNYEALENWFSSTDANSWNHDAFIKDNVFLYMYRNTNNGHYNEYTLDYVDDYNFSLSFFKELSNNSSNLDNSYNFVKRIENRGIYVWTPYIHIIPTNSEWENFKKKNAIDISKDRGYTYFTNFKVDNWIYYFNSKVS